MVEKIPDYILNINNKFLESGFEIYLVGGCVRDLIIGKPISDWDFTTNATPEQILSLFPEGFYDNTFGTVGVEVETSNTKLEEKKDIVEITTYRSDGEYSDHRRPDHVIWGNSIEIDLSRRDFTINAIALKIIYDQDNYSITLVDPFDGQDDIKNKQIKCVNDPKKRFKEDALRLMRAIRLATQLSFSIEENTLSEILADSHLIEKIASERIRDELLKLLSSEYPYEGIMLLKNTNLLKFILPELLEGINISQVRPGRHHTSDVFTHNLLSLKFCPSFDPIVRLATLIHDIGKPRVMSSDNEGYVIFHNHEIVGAAMAKEICDRLRLSKKQRDKIVMLIRWHMFTVDENTTDASIRRFIRRVGVENIQDMIDLRIGDRLGSGTQTAESWRLKLFKKRIEEQLSPAPFSIKDLAINGNDIMQELKISPGPKIGQMLQSLFEEVDEDLTKNNKDFLIRRVKELANKN